jgi:hypothetical protein
MDPAIRVMAAINEVASAEGVPVAIHHVCVACAEAVKASGVGLYLIGDLGLCEPLYVTNPMSEQVAELQVMLGEGPGTEALGEDHPVLAPALGSDASVLRWPAFAPAAIAAGVSAAFAFPLVMGGLSLSMSGFEYRWAVVHQATGMVSVQLNTDLTVAFLRLRAHAYLTGRRMAQVASDVVERRLRFDPDPDINIAGAAGSGG